MMVISPSVCLLVKYGLLGPLRLAYPPPKKLLEYALLIGILNKTSHKDVRTIFSQTKYGTLMNSHNLFLQSRGNPIYQLPRPL